MKCQFEYQMTKTDTSRDHCRVETAGRDVLVCKSVQTSRPSNIPLSTIVDPMLSCYMPGGARDLYQRDDALLYIAYVMLIWAAPIPADRWHCSLWP